MNEHDRTRAKILGLLIRDARLHAGRSPQDCARLLNIEVDDYLQAEQGDIALSLPHLEVLAMFLEVPLSHFWGTETLTQPRRTDYADLLTLRRKVVGGLLKQARVEARRSHEELAAELKTDVAVIQAYEQGTAPIPLFALERLGKYLGVSLDFFVDRGRGPLAEHEARMRIRRHFAELPPEIQAFVTEPINRSYLETAMRLADMDVEQLRRIAEGILDITY